MTERKFNVYYYLASAPKFQHPGSRRQARVLVAAPSQKRAAELFECTSADIANYGGTSGQAPVQKFARAEPECVFVELAHGEFIRADDLPDMSKAFKVDMRDPELYGYETEHAGFGVISASRYSGDANLFMVDYPTGHGITLTISTATLNRNGATDRVFERDNIISVELSEVQWARMISSLNAGAIPCTLRRYHDPKSGEFLTPRLPEKHAADQETFREDIAKRAQKALEDVTDARKRLDEIMKGPLRKGDLAEVVDLLQRAERGAVANMPYAVERAEETIQTATDSAKAEIDAHVDYAMQKLGERALGSKLALAAKEAGFDLAKLGRSVDKHLTAPESDVE